MSTDVRITIDDYDRMIDAGEFEPAEEHHVELIRGEIREMSPIHPPHENAVDRLLYWSIDNCPRDKVRVRSQHSLGIPELESVPQPDLAWVRRQDYSRRRPTTADLFLVVEVSDSSLRFDRGAKADLYAEAGIADYWVVNVVAQTVEVRRNPAGGRYQSVTTARIGESVRPLAFPELELSVADLFCDDSP
jgi:Uma2 family endonuclease